MFLIHTAHCLILVMHYPGLEVKTFATEIMLSYTERCFKLAGIIMGLRT